jgi:hypothetical protein
LLDAADNQDVRILIAASTNTAGKRARGPQKPDDPFYSCTVDRVLLGLQALNFDQFMRVGSLRKISPLLYDHAPQADGKSSCPQFILFGILNSTPEKAAIKDLKQMLKEKAGTEGLVP